MEKFNELLEKLKSNPISQTDGDWAECLPEDIWINYFEENFKKVAHGLNPDTRRWYETSTEVIEIYGKFLGITYVTNVFSEQMDYADCGERVYFEEMKEITIKSYEPAK